MGKTIRFEIAKRLFSTWFQLPENHDYVGLIPDEFFFETKFMKEKQYAEFKQWYDAKHVAIEMGREPLWDFQTEILKYCENDVDILAEAWLMYQNKMFDLTGIFRGGGGAS